MLPRYTVLFRPWPPARLVSASGENGIYGVNGDAKGLFPEIGESADCATRDCAAAA